MPQYFGVAELFRLGDQPVKCQWNFFGKYSTNLIVRIQVILLISIFWLSLIQMWKSVNDADDHLSEFCGRSQFAWTIFGAEEWWTKRKKRGRRVKMSAADVSNLKFARNITFSDAASKSSIMMIFFLHCRLGIWVLEWSHSSRFWSKIFLMTRSENLKDFQMKPKFTQWNLFLTFG